MYLVRTHLFDDVVGNREYSGRHVDPKRSRSLKIECKFELGGLQDGQVRGLRALEDAAGINADLAGHIREIGPVTHETAGSHNFAVRVGCRNPFARRQSCKLHATAVEERVGGNKKRVHALARKHLEGCIDLAGRAGVEDLLDLHAHGAGALAQLAQGSLGA